MEKNFILSIFSLVTMLWYIQPVTAFDRPVDEAQKVLVEIRGITNYEKNLDEEPVNFSVRIVNSSDRELSGKIKVFLNDDWKVVKNSVFEFKIAPKSTLNRQYCARWKTSVLSGFYPIHALTELKEAIEKSSGDIRKIHIFLNEACVR